MHLGSEDYKMSVFRTTVENGLEMVLVLHTADTVCDIDVISNTSQRTSRISTRHCVGVV
jgi:hypothetical protein